MKPIISKTCKYFGNFPQKYINIVNASTIKKNLIDLQEILILNELKIYLLTANKLIQKFCLSNLIKFLKKYKIKI